jgi:hypothetical protein
VVITGYSIFFGGLFLLCGPLADLPLAFVPMSIGALTGVHEADVRLALKAVA